MGERSNCSLGGLGPRRYTDVMKGTALSKDYTHFEKELAGELTAAATTVSMGASGARKVKLPTSELKALIPDGAVLEVAAVQFTKLQMGDVICVNTGREMAVRRYVKLKMTKNGEYLLTAYDNCGKKEALPKSALVGKVVSVQAQGRTYDPRKAENPLAAFWGKLTEYGTHKAFGIFG
jgi:hypothetical protein